MKHLLQPILQMKRFQRAVRHLQHLLHILTNGYIATCTATAYLCFRQYDTPHVNE